MPPYAAWFKSMQRAFINSWDVSDATCDIEIDGDVVIFVAKVKHAWQINSDDYSALAKKYHIDIKGKCYECNLNFAEEFEYNSNGDEVFYKQHRFENYRWECECPTLGG